MVHARICTVYRSRRGYISWRMENRGIFSVSPHHPSKSTKSILGYKLIVIGIRIFLFLVGLLTVDVFALFFFLLYRRNILRECEVMYTWIVLD